MTFEYHFLFITFPFSFPAENVSEQIEEEKEVVQVTETPLVSEPIIIDKLTCHLCLKKFKKGYNLRQHLMIHSNEKPFHCDICGKNFVQKSQLNRHLTSHKLKNQSSKNCEEEISFEAVTKSGRKIAIEPQRLFKCQNCDFETASHPKWLSHSHSQVFDCQNCDKKFASEKSLKSHRKICETTEKDLQCSICQKGFSCQTYLKKHFLTHEQETAIKCKVCDKTFKRMDNLKRHSKIHSEEAQIYKCPFSELNSCQKTFKRYDKLKDHLKTHGK